MTRRAVIAIDIDLRGAATDDSEPGDAATADTLAADLRRMLNNAQWGWLNPEVTVIDAGETT
jgi:hypothetical protein